MAKIENYLLGMDCGTTNIKAIILGEDGTVAAEASRPSRFLSPGPNMQEQDAGEWWGNTVDIFRSLCAQAGPEIVKRIRGISVSSHTVTMLPVDKDGNPLRTAMTYQDNRSAAPRAGPGAGLCHRERTGCREEPEEICGAWGINMQEDSRQFTEKFRQYYGCSPSEYKRKLRNR